MGSGWGYDELAILRSNYAEHGPSWVGWESALPGRTYGAIASMANELGLRMRGRSAAHLDAPDPKERTVVEMMDRGIAPSAIDSLMHWRRGTSKEVLASRWRRVSGSWKI